jgi:hypothetical protein
MTGSSVVGTEWYRYDSSDVHLALPRRLEGDDINRRDVHHIGQATSIGGDGALGLSEPLHHTFMVRFRHGGDCVQGLDGGRVPTHLGRTIPREVSSRCHPDAWSGDRGSKPRALEGSKLLFSGFFRAAPT